MTCRTGTMLLLGGCLWAGGCTAPGTRTTGVETTELRAQAADVVKRAVRYKALGSIRAQGLEVLYRRLTTESLPWLRNALYDDEPGVRFTAACALGDLRDDASYRALLEMADDLNPSLRLAVYYALHRLGDTSYTARLPDMLLHHESPQVRRDAAFVLGLLGESDAVKLLAQAMKDNDASVQHQALASMALLGNDNAIQELTIAASSGPTGYERLEAINALSELEKPNLVDTFRYKLKTGRLLEIQLAAARGLGRLGNGEGFDLALRSLTYNRASDSGDAEPARVQISRIRQLAATALGEIGDSRALPALRQRLHDSSNPHVQVAAADAILNIVDSGSGQALPKRHSRVSPRRGNRR